MPVLPKRRSCEACSVADLQEAGRGTAEPELQPKLTVGEPNDRFEREADRVADAVADASDDAEPIQPKERLAGSGPVISRQSAGAAPPAAIDGACVKERPPKSDEDTGEEGDGGSAATAQRKRRGTGGGTAPAIGERLARARGGGRPLAAAVRRRMEQHIGADFSGVRIHSGAEAADMNRVIDSYAFTSGLDVYFLPGRYQPGTPAGDRLLAHELAHVVQQTGSTSVPAVQRYTTGSEVHANVQSRMRGESENAELITEAPIPGANMHKVGHDREGLADLYRSGGGPKISGVKGSTELLTSLNELRDRRKPKKTRRGAKGDGAIERGPRLKRDRSALIAGTDFANNIKIGDLKPLAYSKVGEGIAQLSNYATGYQSFVATVNNLAGRPPANTTVTALAASDVRIPDDLNYDRFDQEHTQTRRGAFVRGAERYWVAHAGRGIWVYFKLPAKYREATDAEALRSRTAPLVRLRKELAAKGPRASAKRRPGAVRSGPPTRRTATALPRVLPTVLRRKARGDAYWKRRADGWEGRRKQWADPVKKQLRDPKSKLAQIGERAEVDRKLAGRGKTINKTSKERIAEVKALRFWSGARGKFLGRLRFKLGSTFDKIVERYDRLKDRLHKRRRALDSTTGAGFGFGGAASKVVRLLVKGARTGFKAMIKHLIGLIARCLNAMMDKAIDKFAGEATELLAGELATVEEAFCKAKDALQAEWHRFESELGGLIETLKSAKTWGSRIATAITTIRVIAQAIACLTPPGIGCLWGLVAQLGIGAAISLVAGTQTFNDKVVNPIVREIVTPFIDKQFYGVVNQGLEKAGVPKDLHCTVSEADRRGIGDAFELKDGISSRSGLVGKRSRWEKEHEQEIREKLGPLMTSGRGKKPSVRELRSLMKAMEDRSIDDITALLARSKIRGKVPVELAESLAGLEGLKDLASERAGEGKAGPGTKKPKPGTSAGKGAFNLDIAAAERVVGEQKGDTSEVVIVAAQKIPPGYAGEKQPGLTGKGQLYGLSAGSVYPKLLLNGKKHVGFHVALRSTDTIIGITNVPVVIDRLGSTTPDEDGFVEVEFRFAEEWAVPAFDLYLAKDAATLRGRVLVSKSATSKAPTKPAAAP